MAIKCEKVHFSSLFSVLVFFFMTPVNCHRRW